MGFRFVGRHGTGPILPYPKTVTAGAAFAPQDLVVRAADNKYIKVADNGVLASGIAHTKALADGDSVQILPLDSSAIIRATSTGTRTAGLEGSKVSINASQVIDVGDAGNDLCILEAFVGTTEVDITFPPANLTFSGGTEV